MKKNTIWNEAKSDEWLVERSQIEKDQEIEVRDLTNKIEGKQKDKSKIKNDGCLILSPIHKINS